MAVIQISRIQQRKGLLQDLPQLASAEFGWAVDARRLYIGNGTIAEGAPVTGVTEILTQYSDILNISNNYTFKGADSGYTSQTGATALTPIQRTLQQKLDDIVDVRDFGAVGDGITDDTASIQRAIDEVYFGNFALSAFRLRRIIHFPAGTYVLSSSIKIPNYAYLQGEGKSRTTLQQNGTNTPVIEMKDSLGQSGASYGTNGASPSNIINLQDMTIQTAGSQDLLVLNASDTVEIRSIKFVGATTNSTSSSSTYSSIVSGINALSTIASTLSNVSVLDCDFKYLDCGVVLDAYNMRVMGSTFENCGRGIIVDETYNASTDTRNIKITGCTFDSIARQGIQVVASASTTEMIVMSMNNFFGDVGNLYQGAGHAATNVIQLAGRGNYSIGDVFQRPDEDHVAYPRVYFVGGVSQQIGLHGNTGLTLGLSNFSSARILSFAASQTMANTGIVLDGTQGPAKISYWLRRDSVPAYRSGTIDVIFNGTSVQYVDEYNEYPNATNFVYPGPTGVTFAVNSIGGGKANISITTDASGYANVTYQITSLFK
jgi:hypothetical protein